MKIPLFRSPVGPEVLSALSRVIARGQLATGNEVRTFESRLGQWLGNGNVVATSDRSGALTLALCLSGVQAGDEVIVSPLVCLSTAMPIANLQARPRWCDVDPDTGMPDARAVGALVSERTRAVVLYHWAGDAGDLPGLAAVARAHRLKLIDDASSAFGARLGGRRLGNQGNDFTVHSFYAVNVLSTGDGGALACARESDAESARRLRRYGIDRAGFRLPNGDLNPASDIPVAGWSFAMTDLSAALGLAQLDGVEARIARARDNGLWYDAVLRDIPGVRLLRRRADSVSGYWVYGLRVERRDDLIRKLHGQGIGCQRLHLRCDRYGCFGGQAAELPGVAVFDAENLAIPCGWWVSDADRESIAACIRSGW